MANIPVFVIQLVIFGLQSGSSVLISQFWGKGDTESINRVIGLGCYVAGAISLAFASVMFFLPEQLMGLLTDNQELVPLAAQYARIVGFSYIFNSLTGVYVGAHRSMENPKLGMIIFGVSMLTPAELAGICQYAENTYFGKPSGLLDQLTSAVGGIIFADFADPRTPKIEKLHADGLLPEGMFLCVTDTRGSHSELTGEFAAIRQEMEQVAACFGKPLLGQVQETAFWATLPALRSRCGDRAVLRAIHYFEENARTLTQRDALYAKQFPVFAGLVKQSGQASFALCQNVYCTADVRHQGLSVALALSQSILEGTEGAWRMQGGGFAGTIQAYVPGRLLGRYHTAIERVFGQGSCYVLRLREQGAVRVI